ncbi:hypothetical protein F5Y00DRAFT_243598 [Daldinia vernicosa]|uniref:uncharacterized protein n=1 Tax=Daldinia vernicosa TaxID=114800 RepID=UPI002007BF3B|nr:uncharacterized protein F5Y00DRAFT_243598 [Daldinia vernicosa]KAI0846615.1 hypothetical protein F5Y00DRAFT_243598 [Daldinia vernicosa]
MWRYVAMTVAFASHLGTSLLYFISTATIFPTNQILRIAPLLATFSFAILSDDKTRKRNTK